MIATPGAVPMLLALSVGPGEPGFDVRRLVLEKLYPILRKALLEVAGCECWRFILRQENDNLHREHV